MFRVLMRARFRMFRNSVRSSSLAQRIVVAVLAVTAIALFGAFGFICAGVLTAVQIQSGGQPGGPLTPSAAAAIDHIYQYLFFLLLAGSVPIVASSLFHSDDLSLLLTTPVPPTAVVSTKLLDAILANSSQAFVLGLPVLTGIACSSGLGATGWGAWLISTILMIALPPLGSAALLLTAVMCFGMRRVRRAIMVVSLGLSFGIVLLAVVGANQAARAGTFGMDVWRMALNGKVPQATVDSIRGTGAAGTGGSAMRYPSSWATAIVSDASGGRSLGMRGGVGLFALAAITLGLGVFCLVFGTKVMVSDAFMEAGEEASQKRPFSANYRPKIPAGLFPLYGMIMKDLRVIARDTIILSQIGTTLILYLVPFVIRAAQGAQIAGIDELSGYLSLGMVALIVYMITSVISLTSIGLEGRSAWMPLSAPISRGAFLRSKWLLSCCISALIAAPLILISWIVFRWTGLFVLGYCGVIACFCFALSGLGVGLAGLFPRFVYDNPAHRASVWALLLGFLLGTGYLMITAATAILAYDSVTTGLILPERATAAAVVCFLLISAATGGLPIYLAEKRMRYYAWEH